MAGVPPKKNAAFTAYVCVVSQTDTDIFQVNPTIAAGDFQVSTDDGAFGNLATLPTVDPAGGRQIKLELSAGEMNGDVITIIGSDAAGDEWCDVFLQIFTDSAQAGEIKTETAAIVADTNELQTDDVPGLIAALNDLSAAQVNTEVDTALSDYDPPTKAELDAGFAGLNDPTAAAVADAVWDELAAGHMDAGKAGQQLWTDIDAILGDTNELQTDDVPGLIAALNDLSAAQVNTEVDTALADYDGPTHAELISEIDDVQTDIAALNDPTAAAVADAVWDEAAAGHTDAGKAGEQLWTDIDNIQADIVAAIDAVWDEAIAGHLGVGSTGEALAGATAPTADDVADAVWDEAIAGHLGVGSTGEALAGATAPAAGTVADAVWDEVRAGHIAAGTFGATSEWAAAALGAGTTPLEVTVTDGVNPLDGAEVDVTLTTVHTAPVANGYTDAFGKVTFHLDPGTYYIWVQHSRYNGTNPTAKVIP